MTSPTSSVTQAYLFSGSNLTSDQAARTAAMYTSEITRCRSILHIEMPWDLDFAPRVGLMLTGTDLLQTGLYRIERR